MDEPRRESEVQRRLHAIFHPLMCQALDVIYLPAAGLVKLKRATGWRSDFTRRLDHANARTVDRISAEFPELKTEVQRTFDLMAVLSDLERYHFPRWLEWWVKELKREELIK